MNAIARFWSYGSFSAFIAVIMQDATIRHGLGLLDINWIPGYLGAFIAWLIPFGAWSVFRRNAWIWSINAALWMALVTIFGIMAGLSAMPLRKPGTSDLMHYSSMFLSLNIMFSFILALASSLQYGLQPLQPTEKRKRKPDQDVLFEWEREADTKPIKFIHTNPRYDDLPEAIQANKYTDRQKGI